MLHIYNGILLIHKKNKKMPFIETCINLEIVILIIQLFKNSVNFQPKNKEKWWQQENVISWRWKIREWIAWERERKGLGKKKNLPPLNVKNILWIVTKIPCIYIMTFFQRIHDDIYFFKWRQFFKEDKPM